MSKDDKKKKADEIVDEVAAEMGVENEKVPESDESADDVMAGLGGIFDVPGGKKKKKKKKKKKAEPAPEPEEDIEEEEEEAEEADEEADDAEDADEEDVDDAEEDADDEEEEEVEKPKKAKSKSKSKSKKAEPKKAAAKESKKSTAVEGIFQPDAEDDIDLSDPSSYLDDDDLGDFAPKKGMSPALIAGAVIGSLVLAGGVILAVAGSPDNVMALLQGNYRERKIAEAKRIEEEFRQKQLEALDIFGNLLVNGYPQYSTVKLNGQVQYGQTSSEEWRAVRIGPTSTFSNIKVKEKHIVEVSNPGFEPKQVELTRGMWNESAAGGDYIYQFSANLTPVSMEAKQEFDARLSPDVESDYFGAITINTIPAGSKVIFNNHPLVDKDGNELRTPVTFDKFYKKDEKTGKLVEEPVRVDTVLDQGHKIQLQMPESAGTYPKHVMALQRQMWECRWKSEADLKKAKYNPEKDSIQKKCDYVFNYDFSFDALKAYIDAREQQQKEIEEKNKKIREMQAEMMKKKAE